jgi:hypothetical protein
LSNDKTCKLVKIMSGNTWKNLALTAIAATFLVACGDDAPRSGAAPTVKKTTVAANSGSRSPGKPSAPVSIDYEILGKAIVGLPVAINVQVQGTRDDVGPVAVSYTINDTSALLFQEGQVERLEIASLSEASMQQLALDDQIDGHTDPGRQRPAAVADRRRGEGRRGRRTRPVDAVDARHCERSEAIHCRCFTWIASSLRSSQ